jgi:hypothetical protein
MGSGLHLPHDERPAVAGPDASTEARRSPYHWQMRRKEREAEEADNIPDS